MKKEWSKISLVFFFVVALIGTLLRSTFFISIPLEYGNLVHAHSHTAFQGWIYTVIILLLTNLYLKKHQIQKGRYSLQFNLTIFVLIGTLISFSLQGYGLYSIIFSTLFQLLNYWFIYRFIKDTRGINSPSKDTISFRFIKTGLWLGLLSTIMPYGIGLLSAKGLGGTEVYLSFVYTFMHLQYNGWFLFVALGLFYKFLEDNNILFNRNHAIKFYQLFTIAVIPAIALSLLGMSFSKYLILPAYFAALFQALGLLFFILSINSNLKVFLRQKNRWFQLYFIVFLVSFILKIILQCLSVFPVFWSYAFNNKLILLAYLHLSLIGVISFLLLSLIIDLKWITINGFGKVGSALLVLGFIATELLLVTGGLGLYHNHLILMLGSASMAMGIFFLIISLCKKTPNTSLLSF